MDLPQLTNFTTREDSFHRTGTVHIESTILYKYLHDLPYLEIIHAEKDSFRLIDPIEPLIPYLQAIELDGFSKTCEAIIIADNSCNNIKSVVQISNYPNLKTVEFGKQSLNYARSVIIQNNELLKDIIIHDCAMHSIVMFKLDSIVTLIQ